MPGKGTVVKTITQIHFLPVAALALTITLAGGCATYHHAYLQPAANANLSPNGRSAVATADNVSITVTPNAWNGTPNDLYRKVTPVRVRIQNNSKVPIRIVYDDFNLSSPNGQTFAALPPSRITGTEALGDNQLPSKARVVDAAYRQDRDDRDQDGDRDEDRDYDRGGTRVIITPAFDHDDFYYAPYWGYSYYGMGAWPYGWAPDSVYFNTYYPYMSAIQLPTRSMLQKGIPEGVIAPGGYVQGFLYFSKVNPNAEEVDFTARLQNAKMGEQMGAINIPFNVQSQPD